MIVILLFLALSINGLQLGQTFGKYYTIISVFYLSINLRSVKVRRVAGIIAVSAIQHSVPTELSQWRKHQKETHEFCFPKYLSEYLTRLDVLSNDGDMVITVWSCMFMPKTYHVPQLMDNYAKFITVLANRYSLRTISPSTHIRTAPVIKIETQTQKKVFIHVYKPHNKFS